jgi:2-polyprenyl-3-methyl-5-hydroxy-6-metoxy-1,4-benzoquinol methylase
MPVDEWAIKETQQGGFRGLEKIQPYVMRLLSLLRLGDSILDVGCGNGILRKSLPNDVFYTGVDLYAVNDEPWFISGDFMDLKDQYDVVWCSRVILHLKDYIPAIEKLLALSKRICVIVTTLGDIDTYQQKIGGEIVHFRTLPEEVFRSFGKCEITRSNNSLYYCIVYER